MAGITLAQADLYGLNDLSAGLAQSIVTVNPIYNVLPFNPVFGNAYAYNRELATSTAGVFGVDSDITVSSPSVQQVAVPLTTIAVQSHVNGLISAQGIGSNVGTDPKAAVLASAAKACGQKFQNLMVNGDSANANEFDGLIKLMGTSDFSSQVIDHSSDDVALTLDLIDTLVSMVLVGSEGVFLMGNRYAYNKLRSLMRALGGANMTEAANGLPATFNGIPFFRNDYIPTDIDGSTAGNQTWVFAGTFDDGTRTAGMAGLLAAGQPGIVAEDVGLSQSRDEQILRVKMYTGFAVHSVKSIAALKSVTV